MEQKIMKPFDQYEIDWDIDFGTWDIDFGTWDIDTSLTETTKTNTIIKGKKGRSTKTDTLLKDTPPPTLTK